MNTIFDAAQMEIFLVMLVLICVVSIAIIILLMAKLNKISRELDQEVSVIKEDLGRQVALFIIVNFQAIIFKIEKNIQSFPEKLLKFGSIKGRYEDFLNENDYSWLFIDKGRGFLVKLINFCEELCQSNYDKGEEFNKIYEYVEALQTMLSKNPISFHVNGIKDLLNLKAICRNEIFELQALQNKFL
jgi:hypothetical protein